MFQNSLVRSAADLLLSSPTAQKRCVDVPGYEIVAEQMNLQQT